MSTFEDFLATYRFDSTALIAGTLRQSYLTENIITMAIPILGLIKVLPLVSHQPHRSRLFTTDLPRT